MVDAKKVANNILDFLIDPTKIPVRDRLYIGPGETLKNESYEQAKMDSCVAYRDQKHNSDFYPQRNRSINKEATMNRRTLIASFDVLSKNFNENDPFSVELRTMAVAMSKMSDDEAGARIVDGAPDFEGTLVQASGKKTCPDCGQTLYCMTCSKGGKKEKVEKEEPKKKKKADDEGFWSKEASDLVARALVVDVLDVTAAEGEEMDAPAKDAPAKDAPAKDAPAKDAPAKDAPAKDAPAKDAPAKDAPVAEAPVEETMKESNIVDTDVLASISFGDVSIPMNLMAEDVGEMNDEEKARLANLF